MSNPFYTYTSGQPPSQQRALSASIRAEYTAISSGFDAVQTAILAVASGGLTGLLPSQTSNAGRPLITNGTSALWSQAAYFDPVTNKVGVGTTSPTSRLTVSENTANLPTPPASTVAHAAAADGLTTRSVLDGSGAGTSFTGRASGGTIATPSALTTGSSIASLTAFGFGATSYSSSHGGLIGFFAAQNWTDSSRGMYADIFVTQNGTATPARAARFDNDGALLIGTTVNNGAQKLQVVGGIGGDTITATTSITIAGAPAETLAHATATFATIANLGVTTSTANTALANAATAQAAASAAQTTANTGVTNAATAQSTANTAVTNAGVAQTSANNASTAAAAAQATANAAAVDTLALHKAGSETITGVKTFQAGSEPVGKNIPRIWCMFNGTSTGTNAPTAGFNVTSVTRNGVGDYTINFAVTLSSANYGCFPSVGYSANPGCWAVIGRNVTATPLTTNSARIITTVSGSNVDAEIVCVEILAA